VGDEGGGKNAGFFAVTRAAAGQVEFWDLGDVMERREAARGAEAPLRRRRGELVGRGEWGVFLCVAFAADAVVTGAGPAQAALWEQRAGSPSLALPMPATP
jgi:hypothetical protein